MFIYQINSVFEIEGKTYVPGQVVAFDSEIPSQFGSPLLSAPVFVMHVASKEVQS